MATGPYVYDSAIQDHIQTVYNGGLATTFNDRAPALARLAARGRVRYGVGGERYAWPIVKSAHQTASTISDGAVLPEASREEREKAVVDYCIYIKTLRVGRKLKRGATSQLEYWKTKEGIDLVTSELNRALPILSRTMHTHIVNNSSNASTAMASMGDGLGSITNTYAGISRVGNTYWQPYVNNGSLVNRSLTEALMEDMYSNLVDTRGCNPMNMEIWSGRTAFNAARTIANTISPSRNNEPRKLRAGATELWWDDIPIYAMPGMNANTMRWLDFGETENDTIEVIFQHQEDFLFQQENTNSYDDRWSAAAHAQIIYHNPYRQGTLGYVA